MATRGSCIHCGPAGQSAALSPHGRRLVSIAAHLILGVVVFMLTSERWAADRPARKGLQFFIARALSSARPRVEGANPGQTSGTTSAPLPPENRGGKIRWGASQP